jgi:hypothetical protein
LVSITPRRVAAATSKLTHPTATFETIPRRGTPPSFSEMTSVMSVMAASLSFSFRRLRWADRRVLLVALHVEPRPGVERLLRNPLSDQHLGFHAILLTNAEQVT